MQKFINLICFATLFAMAACGGDDSGSGIKMYVIAGSGLLIRADPDTNSSRLGLVPYGKQVEVLGQSEKRMTIGGKSGHWTKISYENKTGWSFGGYLSATPPAAKKKLSKCDRLEICLSKCEDQYPSEEQIGQYTGCFANCEQTIAEASTCGS